METASLHEIFLKSSGVTTDTRKVADNHLFFALKGDHFNGNEFAQQALEKGASFAVIDDVKFENGNQTILVEDSLTALQELAKFHRQYLQLPILALTGSNGKTTTKELLNVVLSKKFKTVATQGNLNNHIGVPLTLLSMDESTTFGIVEMGANHPKEIQFLCNIALPDFGYITNFGKAHLEGFGSIEGVIQAKSELYEHLIKHKKTVFYNVDDPIQRKKLMTHPKVYGFSSNKSGNIADTQIELTQSQPFVTITFQDTLIQSKLIGAYNYTNIAAAICIGDYFDLKVETIREAISQYTPSNNRSQIIEKGKIKIIMDAYNANPSSMQAALANFAQSPQSDKAVIIGDMLELGTEATVEHQNIIRQLEELGFKKVYLIGENFYNTNSDYLKFKNFEDFKSTFTETPKDEFSQAYLIKGSRGIALERVLDLF